jgi:dTDP-4-amino-4,6-dideoxygalactose transaminase
MAVTNNPDLAASMRRLRSHGITSTPADMAPRPDDEIWNYQQIDLGFNYRMTDIHAALGLSQLKRIDDLIAKRHVLAARYNELLKALPVTVPWQHPDGYSSLHLYVIRMKLDKTGASQRQAFNSLHAAGILVNLHYIPVYRQPFYERMGFKKGYCPQAELYFKEALSIPLYPALTQVQQDTVISALKQVMPG